MHQPAVLRSPCAVWRAEDVARIAGSAIAHAPVIGARDVQPILPGLDVWDMWPLADRQGCNVPVCGGVLWFALAAPQLPDPVARHGLARIRLLLQQGGRWLDAGDALPDGFAPGSREWSGSALYQPPYVRLFFTAAGRRGEPRQTVEQRLFESTGRLDEAGGMPAIRDWSAPREMVVSDDDIYMLVNQAEGEPGKLKAFRDPGYFCDPADGASYVVFAASLKGSAHEANGAIGIAREEAGAWRLLPPLLSADGVTNELERPHLLHRNGWYYLFWSTQAQVFAAGGPAGPTGLYGMAAPSLFGPYAPLNGTGLVLANPAAEPLQAYSWWVMGDLSVTSFVDCWGMQGRALADDPALRRNQFGGVPAPFLRLELHGLVTSLGGSGD